MILSEIISREKKNVFVSAWTDEKPKRKDYPLSCKAGGRFPLTRKWRWTTVEFDVSGSSYRIMVAYHKDVPEYQAVLGECDGADTKVIARLEYHGAHPIVGWHIHAVCKDGAEVEAGVMKPHGQRRLPDARSHHRRTKYLDGFSLSEESMNDNMALDIAAKWFGFKHQTSWSI